MKIALIGGSGFLGTRLSRLFDNSQIEHHIFDIDLNINSSKNASFLDVVQKNSLDKLSNYDFIVNLAAVHRDDIEPVSLYDDVNVAGAENICDAARRFNINKMIFISSVAVYGFAKPNTDEDGEHNYFNDYGRTKHLAEKVYKKWFEEDPENRTLVIIRPTVIFGEGNRGNVFNLLNQIQSKKFVMIGDGENEKSMAYVKNVVSFIIYCLSLKKGVHIFNYIDKPDMNMNQLVKRVRNKLFNKNNIGIRLPKFLGIFIGLIADIFAKLINKNLPISYIRVKKFLSTTKFSSSVIDTDFVAPYSLEEGLDNTIQYEFIDDNKNKITFETE